MSLAIHNYWNVFDKTIFGFTLDCNNIVYIPTMTMNLSNIRPVRNHNTYWSLVVLASLVTSSSPIHSMVNPIPGPMH